MKLIVGLGNPGKEYENTRHNVGFMAIDNFLNNVIFKEKYNGLFYEQNINGEKVIFLKPLSYMNNSGIVVSKFIDFYKLDIEDLLIIYDDMDFPVGTFKLRQIGSSGGHNGIKNIINYIKTENFKRIRVGISKASYVKADYVLGKFSKDDKDKITSVLNKINLVIEDFIKLDFDKLMNKYN